MGNLGEIAAFYRQMLDAIESNGGECTDELADTFAKYEDDFHNKVDASRLVLRDLQGEAAKYKRESEELGDIGRAYEASAKRLEAWIKTSMEAAGVKVAGKRVPLQLVRNSATKYEWVSDEPIPGELQRIKVEFDPQAAKRIDESGLPLPRGVLSHRGYHLRPAGIPKKNTKTKDHESGSED